jgi:hypothetical protein
VVAIACPYGNTGCLDIAPFEQRRSSIKRSHANLASDDKRSDMMWTDRVMAMLADNRGRFCGCNPVVTHVSVSFFIAHVQVSCSMGAGSLAD